jgi:predicted PurR-regulated permease PerM
MVRNVTGPEEPPEPTTPVLSDTRRDAVEAVTWQVRVAAAWTWRLIVIGAGIYLLGTIFRRIELVAFTIVIALFLTAVLHPVERRLRRSLPGPRSLPAALTLLIGVAILVGITTFVVWQISSHSSELADQITSSVDKFRNWLRDGPFHVKSSDLDKISKNITDAVKKHQGALISSAIDTVRAVAEGIGAVLLILLTTFFMLRDGETIWNWVMHLFPEAAHRRIDVAGRVGWGTFGRYMRGQLLIALFHGISVTIVLEILRVPLAPALGVLIFLGSFVPLLGLTVTGVLCVAVAILEHGLTAGIVVAISIIVLFQLEGHVLSPFIMSRSVDLHPLAVAISVVTGTLLAGIPGALIAVPFVAFVNTTVRALRAPLPEGRPEEEQEEVVYEEVEGEPPPDSDLHEPDKAKRDKP